MAALLALVSNIDYGMPNYTFNALKMWADSTTCLTVSSSGLPVDRPVSVYCIAPPYVELLGFRSRRLTLDRLDASLMQT